MPISEYDCAMARAATTSDVFNAIAEQQRREILVLLRAGERPVTELAQELGMTQPGASKHLRVLREAGLVRYRQAGKQRLYGLDARGLRPVHEWTGGVERVWEGGCGRRGGEGRGRGDGKRAGGRGGGRGGGVRGQRRGGVGVRDAGTGRDGLPGVDLLDRDRPAGADRAAAR